MMKYLVTENELLSAAIDPADGHLKFTRDNGAVIDAGKASGDVTPEALAARDAAQTSAAQAAASAAQAQGIALGDAYAAQGYVGYYGETPPTETAVNGLPVVWLREAGFLTEIPAVPTQPMWDDAVSEITVPSGVVGVEYQTEGQPLTQGTVVPVEPLPKTVTVDAVALPGYELPVPHSFRHSFPDPGALAQLGSDTFSGGDATSLSGRTWDNAAGGSGSRSWSLKSGGTDGWDITSGALVSSATTGAIVASGVEYARLVVSVDALPASASAQVYLNYVAPGYGFQMIFGGGSVKIYCRDVGDAAMTLKYTVPNVGDPAGTYVFQVFAGTVSLTLPGELPLTFDVSDADPAYLGTGVSLVSTGPGISIQDVQLYQVG